MQTGLESPDMQAKCLNSYKRSEVSNTGNHPGEAGVTLLGKQAREQHCIAE